jgi:mono/diheme cytochrome c family protein
MRPERNDAMRADLVMAAGLLALGTNGAVAQAPPGPAKGGDLAQALCRNCHLIGPNHRGPVPDGVPSVMALAARPGIDADAIKTALIAPPHPLMPDPPLTQAQMGDVAAYILSLGP